MRTLFMLLLIAVVLMGWIEAKAIKKHKSYDKKKGSLYLNDPVAASKEIYGQAIKETSQSMNEAIDKAVDVATEEAVKSFNSALGAPEEKPEKGKKTAAASPVPEDGTDASGSGMEADPAAPAALPAAPGGPQPLATAPMPDAPPPMWAPQQNGAGSPQAAADSIADPASRDGACAVQCPATCAPDCSQQCCSMQETLPPPPVNPRPRPRPRIEIWKERPRYEPGPNIPPPPAPPARPIKLPASCAPPAVCAPPPPAPMPPPPCAPVEQCAPSCAPPMQCAPEPMCQPGCAPPMELMPPPVAAPIGCSPACSPTSCAVGCPSHCCAEYKQVHGIAAARRSELVKDEAQAEQIATNVENTAEKAEEGTEASGSGVASGNEE